MDEPSRSTEPTPPPRPRWLKVLAISAAVVVVLLIVAALVSSDEHGPRRHVPGNENSAGRTPPVGRSA